ncbi:MAG: protein-L-isoaspartate(D-aspartate) O-methyltransferase [Planctomycetota bacterium]|nr:protein-L-isoaspartate(D-aspartate) O-methyltransferase [Planctomycetota bacterium]
MEREMMVEDQLVARRITDPAVLAAARSVPRHLFVPDEVAHLAYEDRPLPIGYGQTISQPFVVAFMTEALRLEPDDKVLEVGTGSGYQAAVLAEIVGDVFTIEIVEELADRAAATLRSLEVHNVHVRAGDGYRGWPEEAPFDAIMVTAAPDHVPEPLMGQLRVGGRLVLPVGEFRQNLKLIVRTEDGYEEEDILPVRFVPMTGEAQGE